MPDARLPTNINEHNQNAPATCVALPRDDERDAARVLVGRRASLAIGLNHLCLAIGFARVWYARDSVFPAATNDFRLLRHSAWQRGGRTEATPTCGAYAARERLPAGLLSCVAE